MILEPPKIKSATVFHISKFPLLPLCSLPPNSYPSSWQPLVVFHPYSFAFSRVPYKWNYVVRSLPSFSILFLKFIHIGARVTSCFLFIPLYRCTKTGLPICQLMDFWDVSILDPLRINLLKISVNKSLLFNKS